MSFPDCDDLQTSDGDSDRKRKLTMFSSHAPLLMLSEPSSSSPPNKISKSVSGISLSERNYNQSAHDSLEPMDTDSGDTRDAANHTRGSSVSLPGIVSAQSQSGHAHTSFHRYDRMVDSVGTPKSVSAFSKVLSLPHGRPFTDTRCATGFVRNADNCAAVGDGLRPPPSYRKPHECMAIISDGSEAKLNSIICKVKCPLSHSIEHQYPPLPTCKKTLMSTGKNCLDTSIRDIASHGIFCLEHLYKGCYSNIFVGYEEQNHRYMIIKLTNSGDHVCKRELRSYRPCLEATHDLKEIQYLRRFQHRHIIKLFDTIDTKSRKTAILLEFCCNGRLSRILEKTKLMTENVAVKFFRQMFSAVNYIHQQGFAIRNISLHHFLLNRSNEVKLIDLSKVTEIAMAPTYLSVGVPGFQAPESMNHSKTSYDVARADVWSLGACLYSMVTGVSTAPSHSLAKNYSSAFVFTPCVRDLLSQEICDLLSGMLDYAPDCRYTLDRIQYSDWLIKTHDALITGQYLLRQPYKVKLSKQEVQTREYFNI